MGLTDLSVNVGQAEVTMGHDQEPIHEQVTPPASRIETQNQSHQEHTVRRIEVRNPVPGYIWSAVDRVPLPGCLC